MIDVVKQTPDIKLQYPIVPPTTLAGDFKGLMSRFAGSVTVGIRMKMRLQLRFQRQLYHRLGNSIRYGRYTESPITS